MINLETDWIKYESTGATAYYGYANPGTDTSSKSWSIRQVIGTGSSMSVSWNVNKQFIYTGIWDNKESHFSYDASASVSLTWSTAESTNSYGITKTSIDMTWTDIPGIDYYQLVISDQNGQIYNSLNETNRNPYIINQITTQTTGNKYQFIGVPSMTYSVNFFNTNTVGTNPDPGNSFTINT
jgi:hypothetical protein